MKELVITEDDERGDGQIIRAALADEMAKALFDIRRLVRQWERYDGEPEYILREIKGVVYDDPIVTALGDG